MGSKCHEGADESPLHPDLQADNYPLKTVEKFTNSDVLRTLLTLLTILIPSLTLAQKKIDLVSHGREVFHTLGCAECHSEIANDNSIKTGPGIYGLFQKKPRDREVLAGGERHRQRVKADFKYFQTSLRKPHEDLSIAETGPTKGKEYLPVMPPYNKSILSDFQAKAIYQYLLTLNPEAQRGPAKVVAENKSGPQIITPLKDANEILVTDRTRIYRTRMKGQSARAVYVGTPTGLNYLFEPATLSIEKVWWGGFINIAGSLDGRGQKPSRLGHNALEAHSGTPLMTPLHLETGKPIDLTFKTPRMQDFKTIANTLNSEVDFVTQLKQAGGSFRGYQHDSVPTFHSQVGDNLFKLKFTVSPKGNATLRLDGSLKKPQTFRLASIIKGKPEDWTVKKLPTELTFTLPVKPAWRPNEAVETAKIQKRKNTPNSNIRLPKGYRAEQITAPLDPHGRPQLFEPLGMDHGSDGSLIIASRTAGIWKLTNQSWEQIAEGLQDCLGVIQEDDGSLIVSQKPELTRLRDTNNDGWYDLYETLTEDFLSSTNYHEYLHGPAKGSDGNYYIALNLTHHREKNAIHKAGGKYMGSQGGYRGWALQVTPEGKTTPYANGLRSPAGLATGPDGQIYYTENQGEYVGTSKLFLLEKDKFYGHPSGLVDLPNMKPNSRQIQWPQVQAKKEKALALMAHSRLANAPGSPAWNPSSEDKAMFVGDQTLSTLFRIQPKPNHEAALLPFADRFPSGLMRMIFDKNGNLYVGQTGRGWRAQGGSEHALVVIKRRPRKTSNRIEDMTRSGNSFTLHFTQNLARIPDSKAISITSWTYLDAPKYGSPENNQTTHPILSVSKGNDSKSLTLTLESLPKDELNRVFFFNSSELPPTKGQAFEAFYSITNK